MQVLPLNYFDYISRVSEANKNDIVFDNLKSLLLNASQEYERSQKHTLLIIKKFDLLGENNEFNKYRISTLKSLMCKCAEKYKCTIIAEIAKKNINKVDSILFAPSRIPVTLKI